jgi:hypothetical protein
MICGRCGASMARDQDGWACRQGHRFPPRRRPAHGTLAGARAHRAAGEPICQECTDAERASVREWRASNPSSARRSAERQNARLRALRRLAEQHPNAFAALLAEELAAAGGLVAEPGGSS